MGEQAVVVVEQSGGHQKKLTTFEGMCLITGYGIGSGVMLLPFYMSKAGIWVGLAIVLAAFVISSIFHLMIGELSLCAGKDSQIVGIMSKFLFKGKLKKVLQWAFFVLMFLTLTGNLAVYISGSALLMENVFGLPGIWGKVAFYVFCALIVLLGLKSIGVSEKVSIIVIAGILALLAVMSFIHVDFQPLPTQVQGVVGTLNLFAKAMFVFVAFFSVPQVVKGLDGDKKKIRTAIIGGMGMNLVLSMIIVFFSLAASPVTSATDAATYMAITEWTSKLPQWTTYVGGVVVLLAFMTTFWSISLALADTVKEQVKIPNIFCWLIGTLPAFLLTLFLGISFMQFVDFAGGVISILIVLLLIPTFILMKKEQTEEQKLLPYNGLPILIIAVAGYLLMAVGSII